MVIVLKKFQVKNKIAIKLTLYFSIVIFTFSIVIGGTFACLFWQHTIDLHKREMQDRAVMRAQMIRDYIAERESFDKSSSKKYLHLFKKAVLGDVWLVDKNMQLLIGGKPLKREYTYKDLPPDAEKVVKEGFEGNTTFGEGFSKLLRVPTLTVGAPVYDENHEIIGVVLLHSPIEGIHDASKQGIYILSISMLIALLLSVLLSIVLSVSFTRPLNKMKQTAGLLAEGNYQARTNVDKHDEIGALAQMLDVLGEKLYESSLESQKLEQLRKAFIANISHELRTPVTVIRGSLEALSDQVVTEPEEVKKYYKEMLSESIFLQRLINDLLDLSRLQNIDFKIEKDTINFCEVIDEVVRVGQKLVKEKEVTLHTELDTNLFVIMGDYGRLRQLLMILVDNAIKFSDKNTTVSILLKDKVLTIRNYGMRIAPEHLPYIFERFYKTPHEENKNGTGLGLAIARQIAERHQIQIVVCSDENGKTEFSLNFP